MTNKQNSDFDIEAYHEQLMNAGKVYLISMGCRINPVAMNAQFLASSKVNPLYNCFTKRVHLHHYNETKGEVLVARLGFEERTIRIVSNNIDVANCFVEGTFTNNPDFTQRADDFDVVGNWTADDEAVEMMAVFLLQLMTGQKEKCIPDQGTLRYLGETAMIRPA